MSSAWYHVIVLGTDLAGLIYAALAAKSGYRVGVLGQGSTRNVYRHGSYTYLKQPERFFGFASSPVIARVLHDLSMQLEMKNLPQAVDPTLQIVTPQMRLDVVPHGHLWRRELAREVPGFSEQLLRYEAWALAQTRQSDAALLGDDLYPPVGLRSSARYRQKLQESPVLAADARHDSPMILQGVRSQFPVIDAPAMHLARVWSHGGNGLASVRLWTHLRAGLVRLPDGLDGLKKLFIRKTQDQCGDYRPNDTAISLTFKRGRVREVVLDRNETLGCEMLVIGSSPAQFARLVPPKERDAPYHRQIIHATTPQAWRVNVNLALAPEVIPEGMGTETLLIDPAMPMLGEHSIWLSRPGVGPHAKREGRPGPESMTASMLLPSTGRPPTAANVRTLVARMMERLRQFIPWLDEHLLDMHVPCLAEDDAEHGDSLNRQALMPTLVQPHPMTLGVGAIPIKTGYKNIAMASDLCFGGLGFEGSFLTALQALEFTRGNIRLKSAFR